MIDDWDVRLRGSHHADPSCADDPPTSRTRERSLLAFLREAEITDCQLVPWGSNYTFAVALERRGEPPLIGIYKPRRGEIPLWDFDSGTLYRREYAAYLLSRVLGWRFIPPTVIRSGPHGVGTVQLYIEPDRSIRDRDLRATNRDELRRVALFDLLTNNADRKGSHCFVGLRYRQIWGIDHGLTFHVDPKLRTVIWDFCGEPIEDDLLERVRALLRHQRRVRSLLAPYLQAAEIDCLFVRARGLLAHPEFPQLSSRRNIPYGW